MNIVLISQIIQIFISVVLVFLTVIQAKGLGLSNTIGASFGFYRSKRGVERIIFVTTIILGVLFVVNSLVLVLVSR